MSFDGLNLNSTLLNALNDLGYTTPTTIQTKAFPVVLSGQDVCGIAQTGTGKTFAYLLPLLRQYKFTKDPYPRIIILVPTRELVVQVVRSVKQLSKYMSIVVTGVYGGVNMKPQAAAVENGTDIVVGTPGRLLDLLLNGSLRPKMLRHLVIDEVDEMMGLGFRTQLNNILDLLPPRRQNLLFSATITEEVEQLMDAYFKSPLRIEAARAGTPLENIAQSAYELPNFHTKVNLLELLLREDSSMSKVLVFVATKSLADQLFEEVEPRFPGQVDVIHSNKEQNYRFNAVNKFEAGDCRLLIATDIIARGIDIAEVTHVINFDLPELPEHYIHRIGRTGRADKQGIAISFVTEKEKEQQQAIETLMQYKIPMLPLPESLPVSDVLTAAEMPQPRLKNIERSLPKLESTNSAFHEKKEKNKKVNVKVRHADKMREKYGKPKKRPKKR